jgi:stage III sporulation protein AB
MLKIIGCTVTLAAGVGLGYCMRRDMAGHLALLYDIRNLLTAISSDARLTLQPIGCILAARSYTDNKVIGEALIEIAECLAAGEGTSGDVIWKNVFKSRRAELSLTSDESELLENAGSAFFGKSIEDNRRQLDYMIGILEEKIADRRLWQRDKARTCVLLGATGGLMIIFILI